MSRKTKSVQGEEVDFDLLQVKSKMQSSEPTLDVKTREDFIHLKRKRRGKSKISEMVAAKAKQHAEQERQEKENKALSAKQKQKEEPAQSDLDLNEVEKVENPKAKKTTRKIVKKTEGNNNE